MRHSREHLDLIYLPEDKWIKIHILKSIVSDIDKLVKERLFPSRQNATNYLVRKGLERYEHPLLYDDFYKTCLTRLDHIEKSLLILLKDREKGENERR